MLTVHHLGHSQSERIVWLCEELGMEYALKRYARRADNRLAPPEYKALHPIGTAPVITDGELTLGESGAIAEYIIQTYGPLATDGGRLALKQGDPHFTDYIYWFHFANGTLQPIMGRIMYIDRLKPAADNPVLLSAKARFDLILSHLEQRLGAAPYLAGSDFTAADIMTVFSLTTMRIFLPFSLAAYPNILGYLQRIGARDGYRRAMAKGDPDLTPILGD